MASNPTLALATGELSGGAIPAFAVGPLAGGSLLAFLGPKVSRLGQNMQMSANGEGCSPIKISSSVKRNNGLVKQAEKAGKNVDVQNALDLPFEKQAVGQVNPSTGKKNLFNGIFEARGKDGGRLYFRNTPDGYEIVGKSSKANQKAVIQTLRSMYGQ